MADDDEGRGKGALAAIDDAADEAEEGEEEEGELVGVAGVKGDADGGEGEDDELDGFVVDEDEEDEEDEDDAGDNGDARRKKKKRRRDASTLRLDDEDYDLIEEAGIRVERPQKEVRRRIKKLKDGGDDQEIDEGIEDDLEDVVEDEEKEKSVDELLDDDGGDGKGFTLGGEAYDQFDELADFIDDREAPAGAPRTQTAGLRAGAPPPDGISAENLQEAQELFGNMFAAEDFRADYYENEDEEREEGEEGDYDGGPDGEIDDEGDTLQRLEQTVEPAILKENFYTALDNAIRTRDVPERLQLQLQKSGDLYSDSGVYETVANWIYSTYFTTKSRWCQARGILEKGLHEIATDIGSRGLTRSIDRGRNADGQLLWYQDHNVQNNIHKGIEELLRLVHDEKLEIPVIGESHKAAMGELLAMRDSEMPSLFDSGYGPNQGHNARCLKRWDILWQIYDADIRWVLLQRRKQRTLEMIEVIEKNLETQIDVSKNLEMMERAKQILREANTEEGINDLDAFVRVHSTHSGEDASRVTGEVSRYRRAQKSSKYKKVIRLFRKTLVDSMGMTPFQLGENLAAGYLKHTAVDPQGNPDDEAVKILKELGEEDEEDGVETMKNSSEYIASVLIAIEPQVRAWARSKFERSAHISTQVTREGLEVVDPFHIYGDIRNIRDKPVTEFQGTLQFAKIIQAQRDGLVDFKVDIADDKKREMLDELKESFFSDSQQWNSFRINALDGALQNILPQLARELRVRLEMEALEVLKEKVTDELWSLISHAPVQLDGDQQGMDEIEHDKRIMTCTWGPGDPPTTFVVVDDRGDLVDYLPCGFLNGTNPNNRFQVEQRDRDKERLVAFIRKHEPHGVFIGATSLPCRQLKDDVAQVVALVIEENPEILGHGFSQIKVEFASEAVSSVWATSRPGLLEFPEHTREVRKAVALGRYLLDPLAITSALHGPRKEILSLKTHPLEYLLSDEARMGIAERVLVTLVNQCGVDINRAVQHPWIGASLSFVCGLGPRKSAMLTKEILRFGGFIEKRRHLMGHETEEGEKIPPFVGAKVFTNIFTGIRISHSEDRGDFDPLDNARVPQTKVTYVLKLAKKALEAAGASVDIGNEYVAKQLMNTPEAMALLKEVAVSEYNDSVRSDHDETLNLLVISDLVDELTVPYAERRGPWREPARFELFSLLSGESADSLRPGRLIQAKVRTLWDHPPRDIRDYVVDEPLAMCALDSGLKGVIPESMLSSQSGQMIRDRLSRDQVVTSRIYSVDFDHFFVILTTRSEDLKNNQMWEEKYCSSQDKYYLVLTAPERRLIEKGQTLNKAAPEVKRKKKKGFISRPIEHPMFRNISAQDADQLLDSRDTGSFVIRPSSKGTSHLSLTIKVYDQVFWHIDIKELGKATDRNDKGRSVNHLRIGSPLVINEDEYEDLDEIIHSFVEPVVEYITDMLDHRKFVKGVQDDVVDRLRAERASSMSIPYAFSINYDRVGTFVLTYIMNTENQTPHRHTLVLTKDGFHFRFQTKNAAKQEFKSVERIVGFFKRNPTFVHTRGLSGEVRPVKRPSSSRMPRPVKA